MSDREKTIGIRLALKDICSKTDFLQNQQYVHTPYDLCGEMVGALLDAMLSEPTLVTPPTEQTFLTINLEFVEVLCYDVGVKKANVWFVTDCPQKAKILAHPRYQGVNVVLADYLSWEGNNMKFDVIAGNPPYQTKSDADDRKTQPIWPDFVKKSIELCKDGGHVCLIHPSGWRDVDGVFKESQALIKANDVKYLEMHSREDGVKTFGVQTTYDWYVLQKKAPTNKTKAKFQDGKVGNIELKTLEFIPNGMFDEIAALIAKNGEERVEILHSYSAYETRKEWITEAPEAKFPYPCVYSTLKSGEIKCWYSTTNKNGHFGIPKVIFTDGTSHPIVDNTGKYGLTQFAYAVVDKPENLLLIQKAMLTEKFIAIMDTCQFRGKHRYNRKIIATFRKDFWKQFVDANGNPI